MNLFDDFCGRKSEDEIIYLLAMRGFPVKGQPGLQRVQKQSRPAGWAAGPVVVSAGPALKRVAVVTLIAMVAAALVLTAVLMALVTT